MIITKKEIAIIILTKNNIATHTGLLSTFSYKIESYMYLVKEISEILLFLKFFPQRSGTHKLSEEDQITENNNNNNNNSNNNNKTK